METNVNRKILIIDDNKSMAKVLSRLFEMKNLDSTVSNDGITGLQLIKNQKFGTILLDLAMPGFSGWDVIKSLEKDDGIKKERIFVFTASALKHSEKEQLNELGIKACINKPADLEMLLKILEV